MCGTLYNISLYGEMWYTVIERLEFEWEIYDCNK